MSACSEFGPEEAELLNVWWRPRRPAPTRKAADPAEPVKAARRAQSNSHSTPRVGLAERLIPDLKQVSAYLGPLRRQTRQPVDACITDDTRVLIAHSLGSVVAYEMLANRSFPRVRTFITLGSPLGSRNVIFDRLQPVPVNGVGAWPGAIREWAMS